MRPHKLSFVALLLAVTLLGGGAAAAQTNKGSARKKRAGSAQARTNKRPASTATSAARTTSAATESVGGAANTGAGGDGAATHEDGVRRITVEQLSDAVKRGAAVIVDVRPPDSYKEGHIAGSLSIPGDQIAARSGELPRGKMIVTYCA